MLQKHRWEQAFLEWLVRFILCLSSLNTRFENTACHLLGSFAFTLSPPTLVRISVSHAHVCLLWLQLKSRVGFDDGLLELKGVMIYMNALPLLLVTFSSQPFTSLVLHSDPVLLSTLFYRCRCRKACFWFYQVDVKISHEKHSYKGPIISILYFYNVKKYSVPWQNLLIYVYVCEKMDMI